MNDDAVIRYRVQIVEIRPRKEGSYQDNVREVFASDVPVEWFEDFRQEVLKALTELGK